tara:strand:+ start:67 stop:294 length:228 start_codon:yes stop_codon:yes gene_type:complete
VDFLIGDLVNVRWYDGVTWSMSTGVIVSYDIEYHDDDEEYHYEVVLACGNKQWLPQACLSELHITESKERINEGR